MEARIKSLTVICGNQCSARCSDCFTNSSPEGRDWISQAHLAKLQAWLRERPAPEHFVVSGGEPGLRPDLLSEILALGAGSRRRIVSNGSWGASLKLRNRVTDVLAERAVERVQVSVGDEHQRWVKGSAVCSAIQAVLERTQASVEVLIEFLETELSDTVRSLLEVAARLDPARVSLHGRIWARLDAGAYVLRAPPPENELPQFCEQLQAPRLIINWDGSVYRCCGTPIRLHHGRPDSAYRVGHLDSGFFVPYSAADTLGDTLQKLTPRDAEVPPAGVRVVGAEWRKLHRCTQCQLITAAHTTRSKSRLTHLAVL